jgi:hypothetical protein
MFSWLLASDGHCQLPNQLKATRVSQRKDTKQTPTRTPPFRALFKPNHHVLPADVRYMRQDHMGRLWASRRVCHAGRARGCAVCVRPKARRLRCRCRPRPWGRGRPGRRWQAGSRGSSVGVIISIIISSIHWRDVRVAVVVLTGRGHPCPSRREVGGSPPPTPPTFCVIPAPPPSTAQCPRALCALIFCSVSCSCVSCSLRLHPMGVVAPPSLPSRN